MNKCHFFYIQAFLPTVSWEILDIIKKTGSYWGFTFYVQNYWCRKFGYQGLAKCSSRRDVTSLCQTAHEFILIYYTVVESQNVPKKEFQALNWWNDTSCWVKSYKKHEKKITIGHFLSSICVNIVNSEYKKTVGTNWNSSNVLTDWYVVCKH